MCRYGVINDLIYGQFPKGVGFRWGVGFREGHGKKGLRIFRGSKNFLSRIGIKFISLVASRYGHHESIHIGVALCQHLVGFSVVIR